MSTYTGQIFQAYRLYSDYEGAFTEGVIATDGGNYTAMSAAIQVISSFQCKGATLLNHPGSSVISYRCA